MAWIKRNLFFAIGGLVALLLMGAGVWYLFSKMGSSNQTEAKLKEAYDTLDSLSGQAPGDPKNAEEQIKQFRELGDRFRVQFKPIPPIPYTTNLASITSAQFATTLQVTLDQLQRAAMAASVDLPPQYAFSFQSERSLMAFAPASLGPLAVQLGEVKAICDILYGVRVNALLSIQREKGVVEDEQGGPENYVEKKSVVSEVATLTPYIISIRCFGADLSALLTAFAASPHCIIVQTVNVEPATDTGSMSGNSAPAPVAQPVQAAVISRGGLPTFLDEAQLKVTLGLQVVKLNPNQKR